MSLDRIILLVMAEFSVLAGLDRILGSKLGLGKAFEKGFCTAGPLALSMIGIMVLAPALSDWLAPLFRLYGSTGLDPAVLAGSLLACDMGGAELAACVAADPNMGLFGGIVVGSMMGVMVSFTMPMALGGLSPEKRNIVSRGLLYGVITIPFGCLVGGIMAGFPLWPVVKNCIPIVLVSGLISVGLWKAQKVILTAFRIFSLLIIAASTFGLVCAGIEFTTDIRVIKNLGSMSEAFVVVGRIAVVLSGAFPMVAFLSKILQKPFRKAGELLHINGTAVAGLLAIPSNSLASYENKDEMDERGLILNMAFSVSAGFVIGDHLAFVAGVAPDMITAMIVGKLTAGILAFLLALWCTKPGKVEAAK